jgi:hypothetical protein
MEEPPDPRKTFDPRTEIGKVLKQINVVEEGIAKPLAGSGMYFPRPTHDSVKIS